ncbi:MAG: YdcF family protein [Oscillospiraceae bacterium]|nr:YdcF family protein [Oscillospiraceae bacterium]
MEASIEGFVKKGVRDQKLIFRRRLNVTIVIAILLAIAAVTAFVLSQMRIPDMHIIFLLALCMFAVVVTTLALWTLSASKRFVRLAKILRRIFVIGLSLALVIFIVLQVLIISGAYTQEADVDAVIVLGAGLRGDEPSVILRTRLHAAMEYVQNRPGVPIIVSGGLGQGRNLTEAQAMFNYLSASGIDESLIWMEGASTSTHENLTFSRELMAQMGLNPETATVAVVSNEFHIFRARMLAQRAGLNAVGVAAATPSLRLQALYFFREAFALANALVR